MSGVVGAVPLHHPADGSPPRDRLGEEFCDAARRLAGLAGLAFGWAPEVFWLATPVELGAIVEAACGGSETLDPPDRGLVARLMEAFPDG